MNSEITLVPEHHLDLLCCCQTMAKVNFPINYLCTNNVLVHASSNGLNQLSLKAAVHNSLIQDDYSVKTGTSQNILADIYFKKRQCWQIKMKIER